MGLVAEARHVAALFRYFWRIHGFSLGWRWLIWLSEGDATAKGDDFDARYGTVTDGELTPDEAGIPAHRRDGAVVYWPTPGPALDALLDHVDPELVARATFVDLGSGKGRAVFTAAQRPFRAVVGVELSGALHEVACANLVAWQRTRGADPRVSFVLGDAARPELPDGPVVLFTYHPFEANVAAELFDHLGAALDARAPDAGPVLLLYRGPSQLPAWPDDLFRCGGRLRPLWRGEERTRWFVARSSLWSS